ncbi:hypothetical protein TeGR_g7719 [Tetraparma gracilis]|uniref:Opsin n=1 Tax=Tetraparma gracilis TaxID=2962635 RepID=A0ABQ6N6W9_9STRA|nr:hypothetical protein TeGR_g7719 [Tetraparma gracilis]
MYRPGGCPFPYVPKGFAYDGEEGFEDVDTTGDCSITYAEALGGGYETKCFVYFGANLLVLCVNLRWCQIFASKRKASGKKEMTVNENLCYINLLITVLHMIICIDPAGHADRIPYLLLNFIMSCIASLMVTIGILLVVSWVTIVEGGKSKKTPDWALKARNFSLAAVYFFEPGFAIVECLVVPFEGGWSGPLNGIKGTIFASICCVWAVICWRFGSKIAGMLKSGGGAAATQAKAIKKFVNVAIFSFGIAVGYKFAFSLPGFFVGSAYDYPACESSIFGIVPVMYLLIQTGVLVAQNPANVKKKVTPSGATTTANTTTSES